MSFKIEDEAAAPLLADLERELDKPEVAQRLRIAHQILSSRLPDPTQLDELDETYRVDINVPELVHETVDGSTLDHGQIQVMGTYLESGHFVWAWNNPSIPAKASAEVATHLKQAPLTAELAKLNSFHIEGELLAGLGALAALELGYHGVYFAPIGNAEAMLLVRLGSEKRGYAYGTPTNTWCLACGALSYADELVKGKLGSLCRECINGQITEIFELQKDSRARDELSSLPHECIYCERSKVQAIVLGFNGSLTICRACHAELRSQ